MVAWTPLLYMRPQMTRASGTYTYQPWTSLRRSSQKTTSPAIAPPSAAKFRSLVKKIAMIRIAKRSSTTARVSRKARSADGREVPMTARTASAKAMSVAVGTAQPSIEPLPRVLTRV
ncbi:hypothetical protein SNARM312S_04695 [Streptomyces narbonensis]